MVARQETPNTPGRQHWNKQLRLQGEAVSEEERKDIQWIYRKTFRLEFVKRAAGMSAGYRK
jgi:hypothetical protein